MKLKVCLLNKATMIIKIELFKNKNHCKDQILKKTLANLLNKTEKNQKSLLFRIRIQMN